MSPKPAASHQPTWVGLLQLLAVGAGLALGLAVRSDEVSAVVLIVLLQLTATVIGWRGIGGPVVYVGAVVLAVVVAASHPALRELVYVGAFPYGHLGLALATHALASRARTVRGLALGVALLALGVLALAGATTAQGMPISMALLSSSVPALAGALVSVTAQLRRARQDRLVRGRSRFAPGTAPDAGRAASSLLTVAMLGESLSADTSDRHTAARAEEIQRIALRGLRADPGEESDRLQIELRVTHTAPDRPGAGPTIPAGSTPVATEGEGPDVVAEREDRDPELSDREREIASLLTTGASNAAIARELYLSEATIKGHVSRMMSKHSCDNRTQLALLATRWPL